MNHLPSAAMAHLLIPLGVVSIELPTAGFYKYDPVADSWTTLANLPTAVGDARSVYAANTNSIYVFGGITDFFNVTVTDLVQIYDVAAGTWTTGPPCLLSGFSLPLFTTIPTEKSTSPAESTARSVPKPTQPGSMIQSLTRGTPRSRPSRWRWAAALSALSGRTCICKVLLETSGATDLNYRYDIVADSWTQMAPMPRARFEAVGAAIGTRTYVVAGGNPFLGLQASAQDRKLASTRAPDTSFNTTFIYDTTTDTWFTGPNTNVRHSFTGGTAIGDLMLVVGGFDGYWRHEYRGKGGTGGLHANADPHMHTAPADAVRARGRRWIGHRFRAK